MAYSIESQEKECRICEGAGFYCRVKISQPTIRTAHFLNGHPDGQLYGTIQDCWTKRRFEESGTKPTLIKSSNLGLIERREPIPPPFVELRQLLKSLGRI